MATESARFYAGKGGIWENRVAKRRLVHSGWRNLSRNPGGDQPRCYAKEIASDSFRS
jgi:hypothetical protein